MTKQRSEYAADFARLVQLIVLGGKNVAIKSVTRDFAPVYNNSFTNPQQI